MGLDNQKGITLVELLAAIVLATIIGGIGYSLLFNGFATYDRVKAESDLRDEADLIMASMVNELFTLKASEIQENCLPEKGTNNYYILLNDGHKIGFIDNKVVLREREIILSNENIGLSNETQMVKGESDGIYEITLVLNIKDRDEKLETISEITIINDTEQGEGNDETSNIQ